MYNKAKEQENSKDEIKILRELDAKQRQILNLFEIQKYVTSKDIADFFQVCSSYSKTTCYKLG